MQTGPRGGSWSTYAGISNHTGSAIGIVGAELGYKLSDALNIHARAAAGRDFSHDRSVYEALITAGGRW